jgi:cytoskeletal protein CcmA (bactofilin family)
MAKTNKNNSYTFIGSGAAFEGSIDVPHEVRISGNFKGSIITSDTLIVGRDGVINADIKARNVIVGGTINGNIISDGTVELEENSEVSGDITAKELIINQGATFHGASKKLLEDSINN